MYNLCHKFALISKYKTRTFNINTIAFLVLANVHLYFQMAYIKFLNYNLYFIISSAITVFHFFKTLCTIWHLSAKKKKQKKILTYSVVKIIIFSLNIWSWKHDQVHTTWIDLAEDIYESSSLRTCETHFCITLRIHLNGTTS